MTIGRLILWVLISFWTGTILWAALSYWNFRRHEKRARKMGQWHFKRMPYPTWDLPYAIPPLLIISWSIYSILFRHVPAFWGLPSVWWYSMSMAGASLILLVEFLNKRWGR